MAALEREQSAFTTPCARRSADSGSCPGHSEDLSLLPLLTVVHDALELFPWVQ